jgi:hypothetical protein
MAKEKEIEIVLSLNNIDELFNAPPVNPFSTHEVDIFGRSALGRVEDHVARLWPRRPTSVQVTLQLPADQVSPGLTEQSRAAVQRYCADRIDKNLLQRGQVIQNSKSQMIGAGIGIAVLLSIITLLVLDPFGLIPDPLRNILIVLASFAISVLIFDSLWSVVFDWVPFNQDNSVCRVLSNIDLSIETQQDKS